MSTNARGWRMMSVVTIPDRYGIDGDRLVHENESKTSRDVFSEYVIEQRYVFFWGGGENLRKFGEICDVPKTLESLGLEPNRLSCHSW